MMTTETTTHRQRSWQRSDTAVANVKCTLKLTIGSLENHVRHLSYAVLWCSGMAHKNPAFIQPFFRNFPAQIQRAI